MKKIIILGTSDAWWMSHSSQQPSKTVYYIEDCRILRVAVRKYMVVTRLLWPWGTQQAGMCHVKYLPVSAMLDFFIQKLMKIIKQVHGSWGFH